MKILSDPWALRPFSFYEQVLTSLHLEFSTCKTHLAKVTSELGNDMIRKEPQQGWALLSPWRLPTPLVLGTLAYLLYLLMDHQLITHLILAHSNISASRMECVCTCVYMCTCVGGRQIALFLHDGYYSYKKYNWHFVHIIFDSEPKKIQRLNLICLYFSS